MNQIQKRTKSKARSQISEFSSYEEEAIWWERHKIADYQDELKIVKARFAKKLS